MLKEEKKSSNDSTSAQPDDEFTSYGKYIAATLRGMDKFHQELLKFNIPQQAEMIKYRKILLNTLASQKLAFDLS